VKANTVYDVFLALPDQEKELLVVLVNDYKFKTKAVLNKTKKKLNYTKNDAIDFLLKTIFTSKK
jgi:hypothetical protein